MSDGSFQKDKSRRREKAPPRAKKTIGRVSTVGRREEEEEGMGEMMVPSYLAKAGGIRGCCTRCWYCSCGCSCCGSCGVA